MEPLGLIEVIGFVTAVEAADAALKAANVSMMVASMYQSVLFQFLFITWFLCDYFPSVGDYNRKLSSKSRFFIKSCNTDTILPYSCNSQLHLQKESQLYHY